GERQGALPTFHVPCPLPLNPYPLEAHLQRRLVLLFALVSLILPACTGGGGGATPAGPPGAAVVATPATQADRLMSSPDYGMSVFLWGAPGSTERDLKLAKDAGFRWV